VPLQMPTGKRLAVSIGTDFDAHSVWMGTFGLTSPGHLSRGEFGAEVGVPRLLALYQEFGIRTTWFTPGHTLLTFRARVDTVLDAGHEVGAHGCWHEPVHTLDSGEERRLVEKTLEVHEKVVGRIPRGFRSPAWDFSDATLDLLEEFGFQWDSSLMGRDFMPYHPRPVHIGWEEGNTFGDPSPILEIPVSWFLDDFPVAEYIPGINPGLGSSDVMFQRFREHFDFAYENVPGGVIAFTVHPQTIGRAHHIIGMRRLIDHMASRSGTWFAPLSDIYDAWHDEEALA
jgi:peptidoglycan-N-acetylglucosamine deacetylase